MTDSTLSALRRRLEKWELEHLRKLAAELHERLERAEDEAARAWECAESWREDTLRLTEELMADGHTIGLTKEGQVVVLGNDAALAPVVITPQNETVVDYWHKFYVDRHCTLCGNHGWIDTRGVSTPAGVAVGRVNYCICPNGQALRAGGGAPPNTINAIAKGAA